MTNIALFHSVLGVRPGVAAAADRLRAAGHDVLVVDQYEGRVFDDYDEADEFAQAIGCPVEALIGSLDPTLNRLLLAIVDQTLAGWLLPVRKRTGCGWRETGRRPQAGSISGMLSR